jgi:uncharacterized protein (TIGR03435 family)
MKPGVVRIADAKGMTLAEFAASVFGDTLDRPVIDQTSIAGLFDIHLEFAGLENSAAPDGDADNAAPSVLTAVQEQLGLKLSPDKGPVEVLVTTSKNPRKTEGRRRVGIIGRSEKRRGT